jgi:hypothetical protein
MPIPIFDPPTSARVTYIAIPEEDRWPKVTIGDLVLPFEEKPTFVYAQKSCEINSN